MGKYWLILLLAGLSEIVWAFGLKRTEGFTDLHWSLVTVFFIVISFYLFAVSIKKIPIGTAYAVFTGIGAAGSAIVGVLVLGEDINLLKVVSLTILIAGIIGLKLVDKKQDV